MQPAHAPTDEQVAIMEAAVRGSNLVIEAGAGTGKTSTLAMVADRLAGRGIYIAFNRQIVVDARHKFGPGVACYTAHQVAYEAIGYHYASRLNGRRMPYLEVAQRLGLPMRFELSNGVVLTRFQAVRHAFATVKRYCQSADDTLRRRHTPTVSGIDGASADEFDDLVLDIAISLWADVGDPNGRFPFQHDHYLKMWSLLDPVLPGDYLMFDEAQDADPLIASVIQSQRCPQIVVGDRNQAIYGWRGAVDALEDWPASIRLRLTQSWRFGAAIADEANKWLSVLGSSLRLSGNPALESIVGDDPAAGAVLCRTNAEAVNEVMSAMDDGRRVALVGGGAVIAGLAKASLELTATGSTDHPELFAFRSWRAVQDYACQDDGNDLRTFVKLVDERGADRIIVSTDRLHDEASADVIVSTCHKTKGREWPSVRLARDFYRQPVDGTGHRRPPPREEAMLAYVAVTRAQRSLDCSALSWIDGYGETLAAVEPSDVGLATAIRR